MTWSSPDGTPSGLLVHPYGPFYWTVKVLYQFDEKLT
jgi:hypothetical protein